MVGERQTRRQKDISRLTREQRQRLRPPRGIIKKASTIHKTTLEVFSRHEKKEIKAYGISIEEAAGQFQLLKSGVSYVKLVRPARLGDGILTIPEGDYPTLTSLHDEAMAAGRMLKFVPASGAATRMFQDWYDFLKNDQAHPNFLTALEKLPFYPEIREIMRQKGCDIEDPSTRLKRAKEIVAFVLKEGGLNFEHLPKALIPFHRYASSSRTAIEEHLVEAAMYVRDRKGCCRLHVTVPPDKEDLMKEFLSHVKPQYEKKYGVTYAIDVSSQSPETDTIALDARGRLYKDEEGHIVFRPGGHGALLKNLQALSGDIVFVKNIDNVVREERLGEIVFWHKVMGGFLLKREREIHDLLWEITRGKLEAAQDYVREVMHLELPEKFYRGRPEEKKEILYDLLHRPIRIGGMVKNEGEPGGGPFWVEMSEGQVSLQIVEEIQVNHASEEQMRRWREATHFNPVDLVLSLRDEKGEHYDLTHFAEPRMAIVTNKSDRGRPIRVLEHPGLWNGQMAGWITFFVEIPLHTFNPVKTYADLLRPAHQPG